MSLLIFFNLTTNKIIKLKKFLFLVMTVTLEDWRMGLSDIFSLKVDHPNNPISIWFHYVISFHQNKYNFQNDFNQLNDVLHWLYK
jgi:hypothetical protein